MNPAHQSNDSEQCIVCRRPLDASDEHVILNAIGGRKSSAKILCSTCNGEFGSTIDAALLLALEPFTLIVDPPTRRRSNGSRKRILDARGIEYDMLAGGKLKVRYKEVAPNRWIADDADKELAIRNAQAAALAHESRTGEAATVTTSSELGLPEGIEFQLTIDNVTALRALLKWVLDLLGMEVLTSDALRLHTPVLEREFVNGGTALPMAGYLQRSLLPQMYDGLEHYVLAMQTPDGSVYWEASAYGGAIAMAGRTAPIGHRFNAVMYRVDPVTGDHSTEHPTGKITDETCKWVANYDATCRTRTAVAAARMNQLMNGRHGVEKLVKECVAEHVPTSGIFTAKHSAAVARCVAEKYMALMRQLHASEGGS